MNELNAVKLDELKIEELTAEELTAVEGGLNPQPLPPRVADFRLVRALNFLMR